MSYVKEPMSIEKKSFEIIDQEMDQGLKSRLTMEELAVVKRVIHTSGDFEYQQLIGFQHNPIEEGIKALSEGTKIYADTNMICAGVNKRTLQRLGCEVYTHVSDEEVAKEAKEKGETRSMIGMKKALEDPQTSIFIIGNAPTALFTLLENRKTDNRPKLVIGVPVGFVGAEESKKELEKTDLPSVVIRGRKGGSTIGVAIFNAMMYLVDNDR